MRLAHYPIFLNLTDRSVLVVGGGKVGLRKARGLVEAGARVTVVASEVVREFESLPVRLIRRRFRESDLRGKCLVFAATNDRATNRRIGAAAQRRGILANIADSAEECDFIVPARVRKAGIHIAISTGGAAPRIASDLRKKLEQIL